MLSELQTWTIVGVASAVWLALSLVGLTNGGWNSISAIAELLPLSLLGASLFERWGWRWSRLHPQPVRTPFIRGTWQGQITSLWKDAEGVSPEPKTVYLSVEQTLTTVFVCLMSNESSSEQVAGTIAKKASGQRFISATYINTPTTNRRDTSRIHYGGLLLTIFGSPATRLEGEYWTERNSKGSLVFRSYSPVLAGSFEDAARLTYANRVAAPA